MFEMRVKHLLSWFFFWLNPLVMVLASSASLLFQIALTRSKSFFFFFFPWWVLSFSCKHNIVFLLGFLEISMFRINCHHFGDDFHFQLRAPFSEYWMYLVMAYWVRTSCMFLGYCNPQFYFNSFYKVYTIGLMDDSTV